jgi:hypothetical protein
VTGAISHPLRRDRRSESLRVVGRDIELARVATDVEVTFTVDLRGFRAVVDVAFLNRILP